VVQDSAMAKDVMAEHARQLGYPDTGFVQVMDDIVRVDTFTPFEEVRLCTQTLLSAEAVLRAEGVLASEAPLRAATPAGRLVVARFPDAPDLAHVVLLAERILVRHARGNIPVASRLRDAGHLVVDTGGRARVYCRIRPEALEAVAISPADVRDCCTYEGVSGLCLTARNPDGSVRLRVFTMSLDGAEDVATGGAAAGLAAYWEGIGVPLTELAVPVYQGFGKAQTRANLHLRFLPDGGIALGGYVKQVAVGKLV
jgi:predicted PhzF superfamily epimerase YddE/YHI9